ncbi:Linearmycin resistance permease protein LnrN [Thermoflexales bacterium]|nr:Linearmycin resistance permease protein LnrN [Thermoflexales bacterium]
MVTTPATSSTANARQHGLLAELSALRAVVRREWTIFRRYPSWIIALFIWPVIFPMAYILSSQALAGPTSGGLQIFQRNAGTTDVVGYIVIGTIIWMWQNIVLWNVGFALREEQLRGTLESSWMSPSWRFSLLLGNSVVQMLVMLIFIGVSLVEFTVFYGVRFNGDPLLVVLMFLLSIPSIYGLGFAFASVVITAREANAFVFLVRGLVMIFCGITYPIAVLPGWMQSVAQFLPQTYIIYGFREAMLNGASFQALLPVYQILVVFGAFWLAVGFALFRRMERRARQTGALGQY